MADYPSFFLLPQTITLYSPMPPDRIEEILRQQVDVRSIPFMSSLPFHGEVKPGGFNISKVIRYRNSFNPTILGTVQPATGGSTLHLTLRLHLFVIGFLLLWTPPWFLVPFAAVIAAISEQRAEPLIGVFIPLLPLVMLLIFNWAFHREAKKVLALFDTLLRATPVAR